MTMEDRVDELREKREETLKGGNEDRIASQHDKDRMTARGRIDYFLDDDTSRGFNQSQTHRNHKFGMEETKSPDDGVITDYGEVDSRTVFIFAYDFTIFGSSLGEVFAGKVYRVMDKAMEVSAPVVGLNDSVGVRIQEGVQSLGDFGEIFRRNTKTPGVIPQISTIMDPYAGGTVYFPALTGFTFMVRDTSHMFIAGPDVIKTVTDEEITFDELGGATTHTLTSGVAHLTTGTGERALDDIHHLFSYLPQNNAEDLPRVEPQGDSERVNDDLVGVMPGQPCRPYDIHNVLDGVLDGGSFLGVQEDFAKNIVIGFDRLGGRSASIVANQPRVGAGTLNINASEKGACFIHFCDSFNIPIPTFMDVPSFLPGTDQEYSDVIRHGTKLLYAYSRTTVPLATVITRKAHGGAYDVMASKHLGTDVDYAWPTAEVAVMGPQGTVNTLYHGEPDAADDPDARRDEPIKEYREEFANPYTAANRGFIDDAIEPDKAHGRLISDLRMPSSKRKS